MSLPHSSWSERHWMRLAVSTAVLTALNDGCANRTRTIHRTKYEGYDSCHAICMEWQSEETSMSGTYKCTCHVHMLLKFVTRGLRSSTTLGQDLDIVKVTTIGYHMNAVNCTLGTVGSKLARSEA